MKKLGSTVFVLLLIMPVIMYGQEKMTEEQAQNELMAVKQQLTETEAKISQLENAIQGLRTEVTDLQARRDELQAKLANLQETWKRCTYGRYTVVDGDWLCTISAKRNVYNMSSKWPTIYEANKDKIKNPNFIYSGWVLLIPTLDNYRVVPGDYLTLIASYLSIYSDAKKWPVIYEANKNKIKDPDLIYPKQEFVIPHE